jgi:PDZ domain-containing protein
MNRRATTLVAALAVFFGLFLVGQRLHVPYVVFLPGPVTDTLGRVPAGDTTTGQPGGEVIQISGARSQPTSGHLYLTTVGIEPGSCSQNPTFWQALKAWFSSDETVVPKQSYCPPGQSSAQVQQQGVSEMSQSQSNAVYAALTELGYQSTGNEVAVESVSSGVPATKLLQPRDLIERAGATPVTTAQQFIKLVQALPPGQSVALRIDRSGVTKTVSVPTVRGPDGKARIGISIGTIPTFNGVSVKIGIDPDVIGGPSAGTALALGIIDKLTPGGLTGGRTIAGTGTVSRTGKVGPIGGIQQKIAAAKSAGATVFFAPASECADAKAAAPSSMQLIRVETLRGAVAALEAIKNGSTAYPHC